MLVETYEVEERGIGGTLEDADTATAIIQKLALRGQKNLISPTGVLVCWQQMTIEQRNVYSVLLPQKCPVAEYSAGPIPTRVLEILARETEAQTFTKGFTVWYSTVDKDPILLGHREFPGQTWAQQDFLLARWGDVLESMDELKRKAKAILVPDISDLLLKAKSKVDGAIPRVESIIDRYLNGRSTNLPSISDYGLD